MSAPTPVAVLTGFLGSGKTTLLSRLITDAESSRCALIINEFGEVSIDHLLVARSVENVIELRSGCLCCTIRGDLALTLRDLHQKRVLGEIAPFDYVVVETTGLADPVPILHTLMTSPHIRKVFVPDSVITCVDYTNAEGTLGEHDCAASQVALADIVVLTKADLATASQRAAVGERVTALNGTALRIEASHGAVAAGDILRRGLFEPKTAMPGRLGGWLAAPAARPSHGESYRSHVIRSAAPVSLAGLAVFLNRLVNRERGNILRIKGIVQPDERAPPGGPAVVHAVGDKFYPIERLPAWPSEDRSSRLVFIGRHLDEDGLAEQFAELCLDS